MFLIIILSFLINTKAYGGTFYEKETDIRIVRNQEKLQQYNNLFVKFIPEYFKFNEQQNLIYDPIDNNSVEKLDKRIQIIEEQYNSDLDFNIYAVVYLYMDNKYTFEYFRIFVNASKQSHNRNGHFLTEMYISQNSITDFFDIIDSAEHTGQTHLIKSKNINIKLLQRYLKNYEKLALKAKPAKGNTDNTNKTKVYRTYSGNDKSTRISKWN